MCLLIGFFYKCHTKIQTCHYWIGRYVFAEKIGFRYDIIQIYTIWSFVTEYHFDMFCTVSIVYPQDFKVLNLYCLIF